MIAFIKRLYRDRRGAALVIAGAALPLLVGSAGLAVDTIQWTLWKRQLQRAADSAAIAGVYQRVQGGGQTEVDDAVERDLEINQKTGIALLNAPDVDLIADDGDQVSQVEVTVKVQKSLSFSSLFLSEAPIITATARAASVPGSDEYCVVSLEPDANKSGIIVGGNAKIEMDCGFISNSPAFNSALSNGNSSTVQASVMAAVGGVQASNNWDVDKYDPYVTAVTDPYANVNIDRAQMDCFVANGNKYPALGQNTSSNFNGASATVSLADAQTANPGANCFKGLTVGVGETVNLPAGTYYIGEGGINVQGTLTGTDVTLVLTNIDTTKPVGTLDVNATATVNLSAPTAAGEPYRGIAIYQDRNAVDGNGINNKINGNATNQVLGAIYFPKQELTYNGEGTAAFVCTRLVGRRVIFTGNAAITNKFEKGSACGAAGLDPIEGGRRVRLVA